MAAEYIAQRGNLDIVLASAASAPRDGHKEHLDISAVPVTQRLSTCP